MLKRVVSFLAVAGALGENSQLRTRKLKAKQNTIVVIVADDQGYNDIGYNTPPEAKFYTPNLDALAADGLKLTRLYAGHCLLFVSQICI